MTMKTVKKIVSTAAFALLVLVASNTTAQNQTRETFIPFLIDINLTDTEVNLTCNDGCAWKTLSFNSTNGNNQWIDASGLTQKNTLSSIDKKLSPFRISFKKVDGKLVLKSTQGAAWKEVPLNADARFTMQINEFGFIQ